MKPEEHEFKVMGLSAYSKKKFILDVYKKVFKKIQKFDGIKIVHNKRPKNLYLYLKEATKDFRFDNIAGGLQFFVEQLMKELLIRIYKKYKIKNFYFSGGVSMNVKMYNNLGKLSFVNFLYSPPSGGDESLSGELMLFNPSSTTFVKHFIAKTQYYGHDDQSSNDFIAGYCNVTAAIDAVQFAFTGGNIESGKIKLYGIKDS